MKKSHHFLILHAVVSALCILCSVTAAHAQTTLLVDFGATQTGNSYALPGWNTVLASTNMEYTGAGPGGVRIAGVPDALTENMGVRGTPRMFIRGERIVATWFNTSDDTIIFTSRISFSDSDVPDGGTSPGDWYTMRRFEDYRMAFTRIAPHAPARTVFNIETSGVHRTQGTHAVVNLGLFIEWEQNDLKSALICDKIELMNDADVLPPSRPTGLTAAAISDSKILLNWAAPPDNTGVAEYLVYLNGQVEGYTREASFTAKLLEHARTYQFTVTALDHSGNESPQSAPVSGSTQNFKGPARAIHPDGFMYLGAIRLPESANWGGEMLAFNPNGEGGNGGAGAADGYPGSMFVSNINTPDYGHVGEVSIPAPKKTVNPDDLNESAILQNYANIRPANVSAWPYVDLWQGGLCCVTMNGMPQVALYSVWSYYYQVEGIKTASLAMCAAENLASATRYGAWFINPRTVAPIDPALNDYLFQLPADWAAANTSGRSLVTGRSREGGLSGLGPTLHAVAPVSYANPPAPDAELPSLSLLQYGPVEGADNYHYPNAFPNYNHADWFRSAAWLSAGSQNAVMLIGNKARGKNWYGYTGESMQHEWVIADVPYPGFGDTDPDGKGWRGNNKIPMIALYDPDDLAKVAHGTMQPFEPEPYAAIRPDSSVFFGKDRLIREAAFDAANRLLYALEFAPDLDGRLILHVWQVNAVTDVVHNEVPLSIELNVFPNPASADLVISTGFARHGFARIVDLLGREIWQGEIAGRRSINVSAWTPGIYSLIAERTVRTFLVSR